MLNDKRSGKNRKEELELLNVNKNLKKVKPPFKRITYTEAVELLAEEEVKWG